MIRVWRKRQHHVARICQKLLLRISIGGDWYFRRGTTATERSLKDPPLLHLTTDDALPCPMHFNCISLQERERENGCEEKVMKKT